MRRTIRIMGIRGIPADHGGFETFCERLALGLVKNGWSVGVYCQEQGTGAPRIERWNGIDRIVIPVPQAGPFGTVNFDWKCVAHASCSQDPVLILGYNTAVFAARLRWKRVPVVFNMDGVEWARDKWSWYEKAWLYGNEFAACRLGNCLIADHPEIAHRFRRRVPASRIVTIPYGAEAVKSADPGLLEALGLEPRGYALIIARPEPENSILEMVSAYGRKRRSIPLVILGDYAPDAGRYPERVRQAAGEQVRFLGPIFDSAIVPALRFHARLYLHGHQVGGTNPSLVESLAAGNPVLAHDNRFNRWTAGEHACYFDDEESCARMLDRTLDDPDLLGRMARGSQSRFTKSFEAAEEFRQYEHCLQQWVTP